MILNRLCRFSHIAWGYILYLIVMVLYRCWPFSKRLLEILLKYSLKQILIGLGVSCEIQGNITKNSTQRILYIGNHDSFMDALILHTFLGFRTIAHDEIDKTLPYLSYYLKNVGNIIINRKKGATHRQIYKIFESLKYWNEFFIFPSGAILKPIEEHCSRSIYTLAKRANALIVPVYFEYEDSALSLKRFSTEKAYFSSLLARKNTEIVIVHYLDAIDPTQYDNSELLISDIQSIYKALREK